MAASASESIRSSNAAVRGSLAFDDAADFEDARRGLLSRLDPCVVRAADGRVVWNNDS
jgi:alkyl sulfatase BDS1-like metallo-beta-lactamase superfamily hydrolase